jgi:hypothetical protein
MHLFVTQLYMFYGTSSLLDTLHLFWETVCHDQCRTLDTSLDKRLSYSDTFTYVHFVYLIY